MLMKLIYYDKMIIGKLWFGGVWIVGLWFKEQKKIIISTLGFITLQLVAITIQEAYVVADFLWKPFAAIHNWKLPINSDPNFKLLALLKFDTILALYALFIGAALLIAKSLKNSQSQLYSFEEELSAALEAVDNGSLTPDAVNGEVKRLFTRIKKGVSNIVNIDDNKVRAVVAYQDNVTASQVFSKMTWGNSITSQQEKWDEAAMRVLLAGGKSHVFWPHPKSTMPDGDAEAYLLVRNVGEEYRLGILFVFNVPVTISEDKWNRLMLEMAPITLLGHVDKVRNIVVNYA
ncbi:hypothetical protein D0U04_20860 [Bacillus clarus]|uniref:Uncharacterized protein n=1 Tax=Bacillus clarus TaxID=2338372 RepID=A0A090Z0H0_9BACI|nr:hypothetical protein [Bacillus clarus]KFN04102.1 hypothetical protein DJ93_3451 [Bacillus clarus]RFT64920.1 hypothetical protein D0U04_20860 [Bacillus clarus]